MAMLAEPRRKQKVINLRAKNNAWSNDNTKWGQRMLEKMGWKSGKGLGANENGMVEHVVAKYKNDDRGLGFEDRNDQWTKHEDDFNSLLANLSNGDAKEEKLHSGISLEVKSKKSKARVHYHKFTRGKDLTRYSDKDLANIFGKKTLKSKEKATEVLKDDVKITEVVFTEKGSMEDYFKNKLAAIKSKTQVSLTNNCDIKDEEKDYSFQGFGGTGNNSEEASEQSTVAFQGFSFYGTKNNGCETSEPPKTPDEPVVKKSKKKKKCQRDMLTINDHENIIEDIDNPEIIQTSPENKTEQTEIIIKKKSKKIKHKMENNTEPTEEPSKKKKCKNKNAERNEIIEEHVDEIVHVPKKKKKRKNKEIA